MRVITNQVRSMMSGVARLIDRVSGGRVRPNHVTLVSLIGHFGVYWALISFRPLLAAGLLTVFGLMDSLDGALARVQKSASTAGMFYDAVSDRLKEVIVFTGLPLFYYGAIGQYDHQLVAWLTDFWYFFGQYTVPIESIIVCCLGLSLLVSYIKAKGEMALAGTVTDKQTLNRVFVGGIASYEIRMAILIIGLLTSLSIVSLHILLVLLVITCLQRLMRIRKGLLLSV